MRSKVRIAIAAVMAPALIGTVALVNAAPTSASSVIKNRVIAHQLAVELGTANARPFEQWVSGGVMDSVYQAAGVYGARLANADASGGYRFQGIKTPPSQGTL